MTLAIGTHLGPHEITALLGKGGMGEVYLAQDTRLNRRVALKVLSRELTDQDSLRRFIQEAKAVSALNHPNIGIPVPNPDFGPFFGRIISSGEPRRPIGKPSRT